MLYALEYYASVCFDVTASHKASVDHMTTIDDVINYDFTKEYPNKLALMIQILLFLAIALAFAYAVAARIKSKKSLVSVFFYSIYFTTMAIHCFFLDWKVFCCSKHI